jgi:uroporphyrinogen-III synthase
VTGYPLDGWTVVVPRGGSWGERVAALLSSRGATPRITSLIAYGPPPDRAALDAALKRLARGEYDWLMATSAATAAVLSESDAIIPSTTRLAAVGHATAAALETAGMPVGYVAGRPSSAVGLVEGWQAEFGAAGPVRVLVLRSDLAAPTVSEGLALLGHSVQSAVAYSTIAPPLDVALVDDARSGGIDAILVTSGSVARAIADGLAPLAPNVVLAAIGPQSADEARAAGFSVSVVSPAQDVEALISALEDFAASAPRDHRDEGDTRS